MNRKDIKWWALLFGIFAAVALLINASVQTGFPSSFQYEGHSYDCSQVTADPLSYPPAVFNGCSTYRP